MIDKNCTEYVQELLNEICCHSAYWDSTYDLLRANYRMLTMLTTDHFKNEMIEQGLFDEKFYRKNYPDYEKYGLSAIDHYIDVGWQMHYNPSEVFNTRRYLGGHLSLQTCPLIHYLQMGRYYASYAYYNGEMQNVRKELPPARRCVYTCLVGAYDTIKKPSYIQAGWDYICFTNDVKLLNAGKKDGWSFRPLVREDLDATRINRYHKLLPHIVLPDYDESLYVDSNVDIISPFIFDLITARGTVGLLLPYHFMEKDSYIHKNWILSTRKYAVEPIQDFTNMMIKSGFPHNYGMTENNCIFRVHANQRFQKIMEEWWNCVVKYCERDQLSLPFLLWKSKIALFDVCFANARSNIRHFRLTHHK